MEKKTDIEQKLAAAEEAITAQEEEKGVRRNVKGNAGRIISAIAVCFSLFQLVTGYFPLIAMYQRVIHVIFGFSLIFLIFPFSQKQRKDRLSWDGVLFVAAPPLHQLLRYYPLYRQGRSGRPRTSRV